MLIDDLSVVESMVAEVEEQAVKLRNESIQEETLAADFPLPYITWPDLLDNFHSRSFLELGYSTQLEREEESEDRLSSRFSHDERFGGRLRQFIDYLVSLIEKGEESLVISRQSNRLHELWQERSVEGESPDAQNIPQFTEASLSEGFILRGEEVALHLITDSEVFGWERPQPRMRQRPVAETPESVYADLLHKINKGLCL